MTHVPGDQEPHKRKRIDEGDNGGGGSPGGGGGVPMRVGGFPQMASHPPHFGTSSAGSINYLSRSNYEKLRLVQGDGDVLSSLLQLLAEYEGVLSRQESFAANLGGKLTAPRLIKAVEGAFEGPILTSPPQSPHTPHSVRWPDIIQYARSSPGGFTMGHLPGGGRVCQFHLKGVRVEVMEDDWRIIATGALDRMIPEAPLEEDEAAELATVEILEARLETLARGAEEVARRAKGLAFALGGRRGGILARRESLGGPGAWGFQAVNAEAGGGGPHAAGRKRRNSGRGGGGPGKTGGDLHADLLQQFSAASSSPGNIPRPIYTGAGAGHHMGPHAVGPAPSQAGPPRGPVYPVVSPTGGRYPPIAPSGRLPAPLPAARKDSASDDGDSPYRPLIMSMVETLGKGDEISPACDRCRRLRVDCVKHLTACQGCTRKHAKCTWKTATEAEIAASRARRENRRRAVEGAAGVMALEPAAGGGVANALAAGDGARAEADDGGCGARKEGKREGAKAGGGETTPMSRMDIDSITTQHEGSPAKLPPTTTTATTTGLPRDPNFLTSPTDGEEGRSLPSAVPIQAGQL